MPLLSIQEMISKTEEQRKLIQQRMDQSGKKGGFHPEETSILHGQGKADFSDLKETIRAIPLGHLINAAAKELGLKEFLIASGTTGLAGAAYLIPDKIYDIMYRSAWATDLTGATAKIVDTPGSTLKFDYAITNQYNAKYFGGGGSLPEETIQTGQVTITPASYGIRPAITNDLIEDAQWDVLQIHLEEAAKAMGQFSTTQWCSTLISASNGDGTLNTLTTGAAGVTDMQDLADAWAGNAEDGYVSDTVITPPFTVADMLSDASVSAYSNEWHTAAVNSPPFLKGTFMGMDVNVLCGEHTAGGNILYSGSKERTLVFSKNDAGLVVRKRWLKLEKYSNPIQDLVGAVISAREGYSTVNKDAICLITEQ